MTRKPADPDALRAAVSAAQPVGPCIDCEDRPAVGCCVDAGIRWEQRAAFAPRSPTVADMLTPIGPGDRR